MSMIPSPTTPTADMLEASVGSSSVYFVSWHILPFSSSKVLLFLSSILLSSGGTTSPTGGLQSSHGGDGGEEIDVGSAQRQLHVVAALRGGAAMLRLLQQPLDAMCSYRHLQQKPAGSYPKTSHSVFFFLHQIADMGMVFLPNLCIDRHLIG